MQHPHGKYLDGTAPRPRRSPAATPTDGSEERDVTQGARQAMDKVTLNQLRDWPPGKVAAQPIEVLVALADSLAEC